MDGMPRPPEAFFEGTPPPVRAYIEQLHAYIEKLEARVAELEARLGKDSTNSSRPPSTEHSHAKPPRPDNPRAPANPWPTSAATWSERTKVRTRTRNVCFLSLPSNNERSEKLPLAGGSARPTGRSDDFTGETPAPIIVNGIRHGCAIPRGPVALVVSPFRRPARI